MKKNNMHNLRSVLLPALLISSLATSAQDIKEAYNLSNLTIQGSARSMGFGNTLGSVGGDFSSISVNPAGLGVYRSSEFTITPSLRLNGTSSQYMGTTTGDNNTHFNINNFGLVFTSAPKGKRYEQRSWKAVSFAFGMNRSADFNYSYTYSGKNTTSSGSQVFESDANQYPGDASAAGPSSALGYIGYQSYLLNQNAAGQYASIVPFSGGVNQLKSAQVSGGINEYLFALGGNYKEKLMLGITIGIPTVNYHSTSYYQETLSADNTASNPYGFNSFNYNQTLDISGTGFNAKIGAIYKINDNFRLGAAFHSPTYYSISDVYTPGITTTHNDSLIILSVDNGALAQNQFNYSFTTPWKGVLSATYIFNKLGFITADYEYVNYSTMRYRYPADQFGNSYQSEQDAMNQDIRNTYKAASDFRLGAEGRLGKYFMLRLGFGYYGNPYKTTDYNAQRIDVSGGVGFHFRHFFTDLAIVHSIYQVEEQPYSVDYSVYNGIPSVISGGAATIPTATTNFSINNLAMTVGVKF
ncbi:MAG: OmpP1/FadL family transporter [Chitinophagales bacterium]